MGRNGMTLKTPLKILLAGSLALALLAAGLSWSLGWIGGGQKLPGRLVDYHKVYDGFWDVACDTALDGSDVGCYIQYVDVYRPRPNFAAAMVEVVMHHGPGGAPDPHVRFDIEPGLSFRDTRIAVLSADGARPRDLSHCASNTCRITCTDGQAVLDLWRGGTALTLTVDEGHDAPARLLWPLQSMPAILDDFAAQRAVRSLP